MALLAFPLASAPKQCAPGDERNGMDMSTHDETHEHDHEHDEHHSSSQSDETASQQAAQAKPDVTREKVTEWTVPNPNTSPSVTEWTIPNPDDTGSESGSDE